MKKAIITGHSKGLGAGMVSCLIEAGYEVLGLSRSGIGSEMAGLSEVALDLGDTAAVSAFATGAEFANFLDGASQAVLINNAGIVEPIAPIGRQDAGKLAQSMAVNVTAALILSDAFVAATKGADRRVAHISSGAGRNAYTGWSVYCATKAAMDMHARAMVEDAVADLKVESIAPGVIDTGMQATIRATPEEDFSILARFKELKEDGGLATAEDTAEKICAHILGDQFGAETITDVRTF
ncbi:SDR family NAD(P)-dependent oxidoreductase [Shimia sp. MIT1388]|uniref:SDR family NAD(P)-dependent oxidoreductase n=1 Tax=Shimia sp. MIT1388 TaxID=3096992 RepID=UPI0039997C52